MFPLLLYLLQARQAGHGRPAGAHPCHLLSSTLECRHFLFSAFHPCRADKQDMAASMDGMVGNYEFAIEEKQAELLVSLIENWLVGELAGRQEGKQQAVSSEAGEESGSQSARSATVTVILTLQWRLFTVPLTISPNHYRPTTAQQPPTHPSLPPPYQTQPNRR